MVKETFNNLARKQGQAFGISGTGKLAGIGVSSTLLKFILLGLALLLGILLLGVWLVARRTKTAGQSVRRRDGTETASILLLLASAVWLGFASWAAYDHLQPHQISIAAGARTAESYGLAQALKTVAARHYPRIRITILEIEEATGLLEQGLIQLAIVPAAAPVGPNARGVAALTPQHLLLARNDVHERVVYALTQTLLERGSELTDASREASFRPLAANAQKPGVSVQSAPPLHPGAAAFYERDQTRLVFRYPFLSALALAALILIALWAWVLRRRTRRKRQAERERQERKFAGLDERAPWSFSKLLMESTETPLRRSA